MNMPQHVAMEDKMVLIGLIPRFALHLKNGH